MGFHWIRCFQYRNLVDARVELQAPRVFLVGENGQGKTNFLEAIYYLCYGSSFRTRSDQQLCRNGRSSMSVSGAFSVDDSGTNEITIQIKSGKKEIRYNNRPITDRKEIVQNIPCIVFAHGDIQFVQGPPDLQRWFFDQTLSLFSATFIDTLRRYRKVLRMRNSALKEERFDLVDTYDPQLASYGLEIQEARASTVEAFNATFGSMITAVSGLEDPVEISYRPSWSGAAALDEATVRDTLIRRRSLDRRMHTTTSGPHRDKFVFSHRGKDFTQIASTGQTRLVSLVLRVSQARFFSETAGRKPILLLDDVLLELDPVRRRRFLEVLPDSEQSFFTFLPDEQYPGHVDAATEVFHVDNGTLTRPNER